MDVLQEFHLNQLAIFIRTQTCLRRQAHFSLPFPSIPCLWSTPTPSNKSCCNGTFMKTQILATLPLWTPQENWRPRQQVEDERRVQPSIRLYQRNGNCFLNLNQASYHPPEAKKKYQAVLWRHQLKTHGELNQFASNVFQPGCRE